MIIKGVTSRNITIRNLLFSKRTNTTNSAKNVENSVSTATQNQVDYLKSKLFEAMSVYEEAIGIKEIKEAQQAVLDAEKQFVEAQKARRDLNQELLISQQKLRNLRDEMDRLSRTDSRYLQLFTEEHALLKNEVFLMNEYKIKENEERDLFFSLSASLRDSQEKERVRVERIKYLQLGLSIACTTLGILSAFVYSYLKNSSINRILTYETTQFSDVKEMMANVLNKQEQLELLIEKSHAILKDNISIVQNESLKLMSQLENKKQEEEKKKVLESNVVAWIESALSESDQNVKEQKDKAAEELVLKEEEFGKDEPVIKDKTDLGNKPSSENDNPSGVITYLRKHTREIIVVATAFLLGTFILNK